MLGSQNAFNRTLRVKQSPFVVPFSVFTMFPEGDRDFHPCFTVEQMKLWKALWPTQGLTS